MSFVAIIHHKAFLMTRKITYQLVALALVLGFGASLLSAAEYKAQAFFDGTDQLLKTYVSHGRVDYAALKTSGALAPLVASIAATDPDAVPAAERKAYLINAYNVLVLDRALAGYPLASVLDDPQFFDRKSVTVGGRKLSLNQLEKGTLFRAYPDARLHFVLVCGAVDCPPLTDFAYRPDKLEAQLDRQTRRALDDADFVRVSGGEVAPSQIFEWYAGDFGGSKAAAVEWINARRSAPLPAGAKVGYYRYDWSLNDRGARTGGAPGPNAPANPLQASPSGGASAVGGAANAARYVVSSTIPAGTFEVKVFNNLYSQEAAGERATFFTTTTSVLYGLTDRVNVGVEGRYRRVRYDAEGLARNFAVLGDAATAGAFRQGLTGFGPKVRIAPFPRLENFSIQSTYYVSTLADAPGTSDGLRFIDFGGDTWITQFFNDVALGSRFSLFTELDLTLEDIGRSEEGRANRFSTPATLIASYFPNPKTTLYALGNYAPIWQADFDYFYQLGGGAKYQANPRLEFELLATTFSNAFLAEVGGTASTVNLGLRFNL